MKVPDDKETHLILQAYYCLMFTMDILSKDISNKRLLRLATRARNRYIRRARKFAPEIMTFASSLEIVPIKKEM